jgi:hypothetical protein
VSPSRSCPVHHGRVDVELLVVPECPNDAAARTLLRTALDDIGLDRLPFRVCVIDSQQLAERRGFIGSPTVLVNGSDPFAEPGRGPGLACRVYSGPDGHSGLPDLRALRRALKVEAARSAQAGSLP